MRGRFLLGQGQPLDHGLFTSFFSSLLVDWAIAGLAVLLLSGCVAPPENGPAIERLPAKYECMALQVIETRAAGHFVQTVNQATAGGVYVDFDWTGNPANLLRLDLMAEWQPTDPTATELRMKARVVEGLGYFEQPAIQGASPLRLVVEFDQAGVLEEPRVYFGSTEDYSGPVYASKILLEQQVTVTITETYRC